MHCIVRLTAALVALLGLGAACGVAPTASIASPTAETSGAAPVPNFSHVFVIVFENKEFTTIAGNPDAPTFNSLAAQYGLATQFYGETHPSLPNYIYMTAGSTYTITTNCETCWLDAPNLADEVEASGRKWRGYFETMPSPCYVGNYKSPSGEIYAQKHNPFIYFNSIRNNPARCANLVPLTTFDGDLASGAFDLMWIMPNMCHSMHDCDVAAGDAWLKAFVPKILDSEAFRTNGALFITFDEGSSQAGCCSDAPGGGQIFMVVASPLARHGFRSTTRYDHDALLATIEAAWNLPRLPVEELGTSQPMGEFFSTP